MKGENGSSALMVRLWACWFLFPCRTTDAFPLLALYLQLSFLLLAYLCLRSSRLPPRRHRNHLCGGQQQLQHGYKGRQQHQQATGSPGSLSQYLEQQVRRKKGRSVRSDSSLSHAKP